MKVLVYAPVFLILVSVGCGSDAEPTPDPWLHLLARVDVAEERTQDLRTSVHILNQMIDTHGRTADCLELGSVTSDIEFQEVEADLEFVRFGLVISDRDAEHHDMLTSLMDINEEYLINVQVFVNEMFDYGEKEGCWPS